MLIGREQQFFVYKVIKFHPPEGLEHIPFPVKVKNRRFKIEVQRLDIFNQVINADHLRIVKRRLYKKVRGVKMAHHFHSRVAFLHKFPFQSIHQALAVLEAAARKFGETDAVFLLIADQYLISIIDQ